MSFGSNPAGIPVLPFSGVTQELDRPDAATRGPALDLTQTPNQRVDGLTGNLLRWFKVSSEVFICEKLTEGVS